MHVDFLMNIQMFRVFALVKNSQALHALVNNRNMVTWLLT